MLSFFKKKAAKSEEAANGKTMKAYLTGKVIPIEEVNDGVFSAKIMGDGIAIIFTAVRLAASKTRTPPGKASAIPCTSSRTCWVRK